MRKCYERIMLMTPQPPDASPFKFDIEAFEILDRAGVFGDRKVELIDGVIEVMNAEYRRHNHVKNELNFRLRVALERIGSAFSAFGEMSLALPSHNLPQPDVAVAIGGLDDRYYEIGDVAMVIEVADTTVRRDLGAKRAMYAAQGVPEYWVVAVPNAEVHQFWSPSPEGFAESRVVPLAGEIRSMTMPDLAIDGRGIL